MTQTIHKHMLDLGETRVYVQPYARLIVFCVLLTIGVTLSIMIDAWTVDEGWWEGAWTGVRQLFLFAVWCVALVYQREVTTWLKHPE